MLKAAAVGECGLTNRWWEAAAAGQVAALRELLRGGYAVETRTARAPAALHMAARGGHEGGEAAARARRVGGRRGGRRRDAAALRGGRGARGLARLLLGRGGAVSAQSRSGDAAHRAAFHGQTATAQALVECGAALDEADGDGDGAALRGGAGPRRLRAVDPDGRAAAPARSNCRASRPRSAAAATARCTARRTRTTRRSCASSCRAAAPARRARRRGRRHAAARRAARGGAVAAVGALLELLEVAGARPGALDAPNREGERAAPGVRRGRGRRGGAAARRGRRRRAPGGAQGGRRSTVPWPPGAPRPRVLLRFQRRGTARTRRAARPARRRRASLRCSALGGACVPATGDAPRQEPEVSGRTLSVDSQGAPEP